MGNGQVDDPKIGSGQGENKHNCRSRRNQEITEWNTLTRVFARVRFLGCFWQAELRHTNHSCMPACSHPDLVETVNGIVEYEQRTARLGLFEPRTNLGSVHTKSMLGWIPRGGGNHADEQARHPGSLSAPVCQSVPADREGRRASRPCLCIPGLGVSWHAQPSQVGQFAHARTTLNPQHPSSRQPDATKRK